MLALITALIAAPVAQKAAMPAEICEVGRAALRDLRTVNQNRQFDAYYAGADPHHQDLLEACPELQSELPTGYPLADDDARARAAIHVPQPGNAPRPAFIYAINVPEISADLKRATVRMGYSCTGLCGAGFEARYVRTRNGWQRQGEIRMLFES
jgi:hypothetical protein